MDRKFSALVAAGTVFTALGIGAVMQYWPTQNNRTDTADAIAAVSVTDLQEVSSTPKPPVSLTDITPMDKTVASILPASLPLGPEEDERTALSEVLETPNLNTLNCSIAMDAKAQAGAMIAVSLTAPCHGNERVTLHHNGLVFTDILQEDGSISVNIPALAEQALVIASFSDGTGSVAKTKVVSVPFYDRVVLQWRGDAGLQLHAREFDAQYFEEGHVWHGSETDTTRATTGNGGFLTSLGLADSPDALVAEVYTFPTGMTELSGTIALTVEAEIIDANCGAVVEAQTLEIRSGQDLRSKELTIDVPSCETVGDFLMLKNIVEDLTIATN